MDSGDRVITALYFIFLLTIFAMIGSMAVHMLQTNTDFTEELRQSEKKSELRRILEKYNDSYLDLTNENSKKIVIEVAKEDVNLKNKYIKNYISNVHGRLVSINGKLFPEDTPEYLKELNVIDKKEFKIDSLKYWEAKVKDNNLYILLVPDGEKGVDDFEELYNQYLSMQE